MELNLRRLNDKSSCVDHIAFPHCFTVAFSIAEFADEAACLLYVAARSKVRCITKDTQSQPPQ